MNPDAHPGREQDLVTVDDAIHVGTKAARIVQNTLLGRCKML